MIWSPSQSSSVRFVADAPPTVAHVPPAASLAMNSTLSKRMSVLCISGVISSIDTAWGYLIGGQEDGLALLGRMAGLRRPTAARLIAEFGALAGISVEDEISRFDSLDDGDVRAALDWWRLPRDFRDARSALKVTRG